jgi:integrase
VTIVRRSGRFGVRIRQGDRWRWLGTFDTEAQARAAQAEARIRPKKGKPVTVGEWSSVWLSDYARSAPATRRTYKYAATQIVRDLGSIQLAEVDRLEARKWARDWPRSTTRIARTMFAGAIDAGLIEVNPFANLRLETPKGRKDIDALTEIEIAALAEMARETCGDYGEEAAAIILTLAFTGLRPGELCALRRADVDFAKAEMVIRFNIDGTGHEKAPKSGKARMVAIPPRALDALRSVLPRLDSPYMFHTARGHRLSKGSLSYVWRPIRSAWVARGGRALDLYELRHACATILIRRGLPAHVVAHQLYGHPEEVRSRDLVRMAFAGEECADVTQDPSAKR